jgi:hypothetical protein
MLKNESLKKYIDELIDEVQKELDESNVTGNVDGYQTPFAFSGKNGKEKRKKTATQLGYSIVDNDVDNITETNLQDRENQLKGLPNGAKVSGGGYGPFVKTHSNTFTNPKTKKMYHSAALVSHIGNFKDFKIHESELKGYLAADVVDDIVKSIGSKFVSGEIKNAPNKNYIYLKLTDIKFGSGVVKMLKSQFGINAKVDKTFGNQPSVSFPSNKVISEGKVKRPVNRWLELKNDESMHANKKLAVGLKELKYQLAEVEKFFSWYNKIKNINELDSSEYWKRTNGHIYKIKERIINIARTLQEIEK